MTGTCGSSAIPERAAMAAAAADFMKVRLCKINPLSKMIPGMFRRAILVLLSDLGRSGAQ
jgi:hypothetical protein